MKYYKDINNEVFAYELDGSQDHLIGDKVLMTDEEVELHKNPPKTAEQLLAEAQALKEATLATLKVTVNGKVFYADTEARLDIGDAIRVAEDSGTTETVWKLAEDFEGKRTAIVTLAELKEVQYRALATKAELVGIPQTEPIETTKEEVVV